MGVSGKGRSVKVKLMALSVMLVVWGYADARGGNSRAPCDRGAGGVSHCKDEKFVCRNGTVSRSKLLCTGK